MLRLIHTSALEIISIKSAFLQILSIAQKKLLRHRALGIIHLMNSFDVELRLLRNNMRFHSATFEALDGEFDGVVHVIDDMVGVGNKIEMIDCFLTLR